MKQLNSIISKETGTECLISNTACRLQIQRLNYLRIQNQLIERLL